MTQAMAFHPLRKLLTAFRLTGAGEEQDASVGTKPLSLLWLSYTTLQCLFDNRCTITSGVFSSSHALRQLSSLNGEKENAVPPTSIKAPHTHTRLTPGHHLLGKAEESEPLTVVGSSFILPCVLSSVVLDSSI